jgi:hypothetical protein
MAPKSAAASPNSPRPLIRDLPPPTLVDLRPVPPPAPAIAQIRSRVTETPAGPDGRPRAPRREVEMTVPGYPGFTVWVWANYPQSILLGMKDESLPEEDKIGLMRRVVLEHNGWCDAEGEPYPPATDVAFWRTIPQELANVLIPLALGGAPAVFPTSVSPTGGR